VLAEFAPGAMHAGRRADFAASSGWARSMKKLIEPTYL
jgi:hypothetical protein